MKADEAGYDLIVAIVPKGGAERALRASQDAGAEGGTIVYGRGAGIHEKRKVLGVPIEPEKEILLTVVPQTCSQTVLDSIVSATKLEKPGNGIAFVVDVKKVAGICHLGSCADVRPESQQKDHGGIEG